MGDPTTSRNGNGVHEEKENGLPDGFVSATSGTVIEYYILCPQRPTDVPGLITHLISRDICEERQAENYHKCPNCIRSRVWRERNGLPVEQHA